MPGDSPRGRFHRTGLAVVCGLVLAGCSGEGEPTASRSSPAAVPTTAATSPPAGTASPGSGPAIPCEHDLGGTAPDPDWGRLVLDAVAIPTFQMVPAETIEPGWLYAKDGLQVRAGTPVDISVAPEAAAWARIGWGSPGPKGTTIHVPACPSRSGWLAFAGGYWVREPRCLPLIVEVGGRRERVSVSVGAACPPA